jgi:hypothetical protein
MLFQHYHVSTNLSKKLDVPLGYLQLQLGTPHNPFTQDYSKMGCLAPLSWVKMLWKSLNHFDITLYMSFPTIKLPRERDQAIMDIIFAQNLDPTDITRINRCRVHLQTIFLSEITMADGTYLKHFVFNPGRATARSRYTFSQEQPSRCDWDQWINFWHEYSSTGGEAENLSRRMDQPNPQNLALVLQQGKRQALPRQRDKEKVLQMSIRMVMHPINGHVQINAHGDVSQDLHHMNPHISNPNI